MPIVTLTSDIGERDFLVGAVKGQLLQWLPDANLVDISHQLRPFNYPQAAYVCRNAIRHFPEYSFHIILINLFENNKPLLLAYHNKQYILCADNGLISMILEGTPETVIGLIVPEGQEKTTIHVINSFAKAIKEVHAGAPLHTVGIPDIEIIEKNPLNPLLASDWIEGQIIFVDHFENVVINITRQAFEQHRRGRRFTILFKRDEVIDKISNTYSDVPEGEKLALFNSAGYLEIAINKGNAAGLLGLQGYSEKQSAHLQNRLYYQTVKVFFE